MTFGISLLFAGADGFVHGDYAVFRTVMFTAGTLMVALLLASHFRHIKRNFLKEGILVGVVWLELNVALDFLTVVPRSGWVWWTISPGSASIMWGSPYWRF